MSRRPPRRMPTVAAIAAHWDVEPDQCMRCGLLGKPDRAHLVDRCDGGLDGVQNLVLLCSPCHKAMPPMWNGEGVRALAWVWHPNYDEYLMWLARKTRALRPRDWLSCLVGCLSPDEFIRLDFDWSRAATGLLPEPAI